MDLASDLPVTLVIKAPNQRVGDQTVECMLGWTVRKLKQHLTNVYPSKPVSFALHVKRLGGVLGLIGFLEFYAKRKDCLSGELMFCHFIISGK